MIIVLARVTTSAPDMALASDVDPLHDRQVDDHDRGCRDAHVSDIEDRPVRQLKKVDHLTAEHSRWSEQAIGEIACDTGTQEANGYGPGWMTDSGDQLDDHEAKYQDPRDGKYISKTLALAEGSTGVSNESQSEQPTEQPYRGKRFELGYRDDLGDKISCQPGKGDKGNDKAQAPSLERASAAD
jgi:hypothetical protein